MRAKCGPSLHRACTIRTVPISFIPVGSGRIWKPRLGGGVRQRWVQHISPSLTAICGGLRRLLCKTELILVPPSKRCCRAEVAWMQANCSFEPAEWQLSPHPLPPTEWELLMGSNHVRFHLGSKHPAQILAHSRAPGHAFDEDTHSSL